ncbi:MAG: aminomethyl-transferring glycine dehydrogenase subunit GcvPB [Peptococcaceae bacterium]|nr:aminomethyl-transferring glycine dehydrogenase subunit GcvPB [Peptococcaceae bacterium]
MQLIFEKSKAGRGCTLLPACDVPEVQLPEELKREQALNLPELAETDISRHYTALAKRAYGVNDGFYPLGSCTMKYNPRIDEEIAALTGFTGVHPLQPAETTEGCQKVLALAEQYLCEATGMDAITFQPAAGAHGEFTGLLLIKAYHEARGEQHRNKIIIPDAAHGTNPASAVMAGFSVVTIPSGADGCVDLEALKASVDENTAGLMLTNPNTVGIFDSNILEITDIIHQAGGLNYYDGANFNAIMGVVRPGDMGFDVVHLNLHKTFATPHGGGGPGSGPVACKEILKPYLPGCASLTGEQPKLQMKAFHGNFLVVVKALTYMLTLGAEGIRNACETAVLNANYMMEGLKDLYPVAYGERCMHEFVLCLENLKKETGVSALDVAKSLIDHEIHPPTMYFPLIVHEALMFEPTETEAKETLDEAIAVMRELHKMAYEDAEQMHHAPHHAQIKRPDEVLAARQPILRYQAD